MKKKYSRGLVVLLGVIILGSTPFIVAAATPTPVPQSSQPALLLDVTKIASPPTAEENLSSQTLPSIHITGIKDFKNSDGIVTGSIVVTNAEKETFGDLQYQMQLLGPLTAVPKPGEIIFDTAPEFDNVIVKDSFSLTGKSEKTISFSYRIPSVPVGKYRLRLQVLTSKGWKLGWKDSDVEVSLNAQTPKNFALIETGVVAPAGTTEVAAPDSGVNVAPKSQLALKFSAVNSKKTSTTLIPQLSVWEFSRNRTLVATEKKDPIVLSGSQPKEFSIPVTAMEKPESYYSELSLIDSDGNKASNTFSFRWVVIGESAEITVAKVEKPVYTQGEIMPVVAEIIGSADRQTKATVFVEADVLQNGIKVGYQKTDQLVLGDSTRVVRINVPLSENATDPVVKVRIVSKEGTTLDEDVITLPHGEPANKPVAIVDPLRKSPLFSNGLLAIGAFIAIIVIIIIVLLVLRSRSRSSGKGLPWKQMVIIGAVGASVFGLATTASAVTYKNADWFYSYWNGGIGYEAYEVWCYGDYDNPNDCNFGGRRFFNNSPLWGATYPASSASQYLVPIEGYINYTACQNSETTVAFYTATSESPSWQYQVGWKGTYKCKNNSFCSIAQNYTGSASYTRGSNYPLNVWLSTWMDEWLKHKTPWGSLDGNDRRWANMFRVDFKLQNYAIGSNGGVSCNAGVATGWACDSFDYNQPLNVHFYVDGAAVPPYSYIRGATIADQPGEPAIGSLCGGYPNHRYVWTIPNDLKDGLTHSLYAYAIGLNNSGLNPLLGSAPVTFNCPAPVLAPTVSLTALPTSVDSGSASTLSWSTTNNPTSCTASGDWSGSKNTSSGTESTGILSVLGLKTYTLTCSNAGGSEHSTATVNVKTPTPVVAPLTCVAPTSVITGGAITFTVSGGTGTGYDFALPLPSGVTSSPSTPLTATFSTPGSNIQVTVKDDGGNTKICPSVTVRNRIVPGDIREL